MLVAKALTMKPTLRRRPPQMTTGRMPNLLVSALVPGAETGEEIPDNDTRWRHPKCLVMLRDLLYKVCY